MKTTKLPRRLQFLMSEYQRGSGQAIAPVIPLLTLYRDYCDWAERIGVTALDVDAFAIMLTSRYGLVRCRLPDGSIGVLGISLKAAMATGVMQ